MDALELFLDRYLPRLELEMRAVIRDQGPAQGNLSGLLRYHLGWVDASFEPCDTPSGKRIRPVLCLLACEGCDGPWERALPAAAAVELLHNFTLIHDDIEDRDETRRGRPTLWSLWGEAQAINAGDTLFALSQLAMARLQERGVPAATVVNVLRLFNEACVAVTGGQHLDIGFESRDDVPIEDYLAMVEGKTATLLACCCEVGALVAGAPDAQREGLRAFGRHLGLAFQMQDDVLGIWGDPTVTGKPVGADIARRKKTLPLLHALTCSAELRSLMDQDALSGADLRRATDLLEEAGSREFAEHLARQHHGQALAALDDGMLDHRVDQAIRALTRRLVARRR